METTEAARQRHWAWSVAELLVLLPLVVNALDLGSDAYPTLRNEAYPLRAPQDERDQHYFLALLFVYVAARAPAAYRKLAATPIPRKPLIVLTTLGVIELGHVAFHVEVYPFSHVGMFSFVEPAPTETWWTDAYFVEAADGEVEPFSYFRLGDPWLAEPVSLDARTAWICWEHRGKERVKAELEARLHEAGYTSGPMWRRAEVRLRDGAVLQHFDPKRQHYLEAEHPVAGHGLRRKGPR